MTADDFGSDYSRSLRRTRNSELLKEPYQEGGFLLDQAPQWATGSYSGYTFQAEEAYVEEQNRKRFGSGTSVPSGNKRAARTPQDPEPTEAPTTQKNAPLGHLLNRPGGLFGGPHSHW